MARGTKTTEFLKECMADALIKLIAEKDIGKISVSEITTLAGVGRATWFRNFESKSDAVTYKLVQLWKRWASEHNISESCQLNFKNAKDFFLFNYDIRTLIDTIYAVGMQNCIYNAFCFVMDSQYGTERKSERLWMGNSMELWNQSDESVRETNVFTVKTIDIAE